MNVLHCPQVLVLRLADCSSAGPPLPAVLTTLPLAAIVMLMFMSMSMSLFSFRPFVLSSFRPYFLSPPSLPPFSFPKVVTSFHAMRNEMLDHARANLSAAIHTFGMYVYIYI